MPRGLLRPKLARLLDAFISGTVEKAIYDAKALEIRDEVERIKIRPAVSPRLGGGPIFRIEATEQDTRRDR